MAILQAPGSRYPNEVAHIASASPGGGRFPLRPPLRPLMALIKVFKGLAALRWLIKFLKKALAGLNTRALSRGQQNALQSPFKGI